MQLLLLSLKLNSGIWFATYNWECNEWPQLYLDEGKLSSSVNYRKQSDIDHQIYCVKLGGRNVRPQETAAKVLYGVICDCNKCINWKNIGSCQGQVI